MMRRLGASKTERKKATQTMRKECSDCEFHIGFRNDEYCNADDGEKYFLEPYKCPSFKWHDKRLEIADKWQREFDNMLAPLKVKPTFDELAEAAVCFSTDLEADEYGVYK